MDSQKMIARLVIVIKLSLVTLKEVAIAIVLLCDRMMAYNVNVLYIPRHFELNVNVKRLITIAIVTKI